MAIEQLNIEGKRSGEGFIAHRQSLLGALGRASADRVNLMGFTIGRKGLVSYLKALGGANVIKVVPFAGDASVSRITGKSLKVVCGTSTGYVSNNEWISDKTASGFCDLKVNPRYSILPNLGTLELAEALERALIFTSTESSRPVLQGVSFKAKGGKLELVSADGYRLAVITLDFNGEGEAVIHRDELKSMAQALKRARRVRLSFETDQATKRNYLIIETELIRYRFSGLSGSFPDYKALIPKDFKAGLSLETGEALKALGSLRVLSDVKGYPVDLTIGDGKVIMTSTDDKGMTKISAETSGEPMKLRLDGSFLNDALKAFGGMVELQLTDAKSPVLFTAESFKLVLMPMAAGKGQAEASKDAEAKAETADKPKAKEAPIKPDKDAKKAVAEAKATTAKPVTKAKVKEPVAV